MIGSLLLFFTGCSYPEDPKPEREHLSRFDRKGDHPVAAKEDAPPPIEIKMSEVPIVNAVFSDEEDDILVVLEPPEEEELMGPPEPDAFPPLEQQIEEQAVKVDSFEKDTKELEKAVRKKKASDTGKMVKEAF